ncbi:hydroxyquinol 1,2-dioxygenase [Pandoraea cepalis]|uniref:Hydroxyquinol 1,2-dioxygenase n=1 Tax=Pandoraea cepalis TaxID=2508294 RepID=A0AAW7MQP8_9BURK|nr:intradiol ring-cleavage dioxygenase [Pandoraea cepalis]MDN4574898.1 hydroxyquinol 1,2-dioxygenase [Pandoraea cepalis]MDN4578968.1 hydroxyquinol 1,2-dioxygenase [Pandoraea cepalis]
MKNLNEFNLTEAVTALHRDIDNTRLKVVMDSLVKHLHDFARDVSLTESEWMAGIEFLTAVGQICSPTRQEFILLSDTLGLSMLVNAMNQRKPAGCTESTVLGPFHTDDAPPAANGEDIAAGAPGDPCFVRCTVRNDAGEPLKGARVDVWQADEAGNYDVQYAGDDRRARALLRTDDGGAFWFWSIVANQYPIPHDGPVGKMLDALGRHPWRPAHLHFMIDAEGYPRLTTHVFRNGDPYLDSDAVLAVRSSLIADWVRHEPGQAPDGSRQDTPYYTLEYDFVLSRERDVPAPASH